MTAPSSFSFASYACLASIKGRYIAEADSPARPFSRTAFQRDRDRIIHSVAFRRLKHKTQVFLYHEGDYYRTRLTHSLEVAQIARTMARALGLNEDIAEAVALAHDLGHPPFGHAGETALNEVMADYGGFDHNEQSVRVLTLLEERYARFNGLNLTFETIDGVVKHNGPMTDKVRPTIAAFDKDWGLDLALWPSLEAQLANLSDDIAYMSHDFDDALRAGLVTINQIDELPVVGDVLREIHNQHCNLSMGRLTHELTRRLISYFVQDALVNTTSLLADVNPETAEDIRTAGQALAGHSGQAAEELAALRSFLMAYSWRHYKVNRMTSKSKKQLAALFDRLLSETNLMPTEWQDKLKDQTRAEKARIIADYVASMTDRYALLEYERIFETGPILV